MVKWTDRQREAIDARGNILVSAAAGSGKTAVLVERIIKKISSSENPQSIENLLVVTFTNAAAAQMKQKITEAIIKKIEEKDSEHLKKQLLLVDTAKITTIHSFCLEVIRTYSPNISCNIAESSEISLIKSESIDELFEEAYEKEDAGFISLMDEYTTFKSDTKFKKLILSAYDFIISIPFFEKWLNEKESLHRCASSDFASSQFADIIYDMLIYDMSIYLQKYNEALLSFDTKSDIFTVLNSELSLIKNIIAFAENKGWNDIFDCLSGADIPNLKCKDDAFEDFKGVRTRFKKDIGKYRENIINSYASDIEKDIKSTLPSINAISTLLKRFNEIYKAKKQDKNIIDFNDLEHITLDLLYANKDGVLAPTPLCDTLKNQFSEVLIDEYQDINDVQEAILAAVSGKNNSFMVGDIKQSIYRFRHTNPKLFLEKRSLYSESEGNGRAIFLQHNFRCKAPIIKLVNFLFSNIFSPRIGEIEYNESEQLIKGRNYLLPDDSFKPELLLASVKNIDVAEDEEKSSLQDGEDEESYNSAAVEAKIIADKIKSLLSEGFMIEDEQNGSLISRPVREGDIVILLRNTKNYSNVIEDELLKNKIPVYNDVSSGFFMSQEVKIILNFLAIIDNPLNDIALVSVMRSPIFWFDEKELAEIKITSPNGYFYDAVKNQSLKDTALGVKAKHFIDVVNDLREKSTYLSPDRLINGIYEINGFYNFCTGLADGEIKGNNLDLLLNRAVKFSKSSYKGLFNFIKFLERIKESGGDMGSAKMINENHNVVRIMSIHKSKGLEYPVVFVSGLAKRFNKTDEYSVLLMDKDLGFGLNVYDNTLKYTYPSTIKLAIKQKMSLENMSEELRILYVALTRARDKLILTGVLRTDLYEHIEGMKKQHDDYILKSSCYLNTILPCLLNQRDFIDVNIIADVKAKSFTREERDAELDEELCTLIKDRFSYAYPHESATSLPAKISVTEYKRLKDEEEKEVLFNLYENNDLRAPLSEDGLKRGNLMHLVMQTIPISPAIKKVDVLNHISDLYNDKLINEDDIKVINANKILNFFKSDLGKIMMYSDKIYREIPFVLEKSVKNIYTNVENCDNIIVQGIIDVVFVNCNKIYLLDYKTNFVHNNKHQIKNKYAPQIEIYAEGVEKIFGASPFYKGLYLFDDNSFIEY